MNVTLEVRFPDHRVAGFCEHWFDRLMPAVKASSTFRMVSRGAGQFPTTEGFRVELPVECLDYVQGTLTKDPLTLFGGPFDMKVHGLPDPIDD